MIPFLPPPCPSPGWPAHPFYPLLPCCRHLPRAQFLLESVADLKKQLRKLGSDLAVTVGKPEHILPGLLMGCPSSLVLTMEESTSEEKTVDAAVVKALDPAGSRLQKVWGHTLYHLDDLQGNGGPFSSGGIKTMPNIFTPFKEQPQWPSLATAVTAAAEGVLEPKHQGRAVWGSCWPGRLTGLVCPGQTSSSQRSDDVI
ncbi:deoxyribodipyrimidine photo-lyase [Haematococcus lacustris]|uniref:Deoxyribodipyrimidine photo-lyase n=1 Tax=Haematococcus lacustris TaxID=44745 RepID=A0A699Z5S3_HAELA|nr:deoxyribodipyrimidine photo-lyase [Haematococcus lacustris]